MRHGGQLLFAIGVLLTVFSVFNGQTLFGIALAQGTSLADAASNVSVLKKDNSVEYIACVSNNSWRKPTIDEQALRLERDRTYGYFEDDERERFVASFWREGLDSGWGMVDYSGLWRIQDAGLDVVAIARAGCPNFKNPQGRTQINLWLLNYFVDSTELLNGRIVVQVRRKEIGFQMVEVLAPRGTKPTKIPIDFIDHEGRVLETIAPDAAWSRVTIAPGTAGAPRQRPTGKVDIVPGSRTDLRDAPVAPPPVRLR